jgi:S1-C subfamily serine protease
VVVVTTENARQRPIAVGSGFVVKPGVVATNFHVIRNARSGQVRLVGDTESSPIRGVVAVDRKFDLALLSVPDLAAPPLSIGDSEEMGIGDRIYVVGNPQSLEGTFSEGIVSGKRSIESVRMLQFTAPISTGSSGGPLLDREARVVGIVSSSMRDGQNLNFAILSSHLRGLLDQDGELEELALAAQPERPQAGQSRRGSGRGPDWLSRITRLLRFD